MSKELKALARITKFMSNNTVHWKQDIAMIETALKDYNQLKINYRELEDVNAFYACECKDKLKALEIIKECLVSEFKLFEKDGEYFILFYFDETHELIFKLRNKEEYDLLKEVLLYE